MATIKSYSDLQQSKKLAEILPIESADQTWARIAIAGANLDVPEEIQYRHNGDMPFQYYSGIGTPCWSLAALLGVLPKDESIDCSISFGYYNGKGEYIEKWLCAFEMLFRAAPVYWCKLNRANGSTFRYNRITTIQIIPEVEHNGSTQYYFKPGRNTTTAFIQS